MPQPFTVCSMSTPAKACIGADVREISEILILASQR